MTDLVFLDDEPQVLNAIKREFRKRPDLDIAYFDDPEQALYFLSEHPIEVVVSDYTLPTIDGITFLQFVQSLQPNCVCILLSGNADTSALGRAINQIQLFKYLEKPWTQEDLQTAVDEALAEFERNAISKYVLENGLEQLINHNEGAHRLLEALRK